MIRVRTGGIEGCAHRPPDGDTVFLDVAEVVGLKRVPEGEDDGRVVRPLEVHLHIGVVQSDPELFYVCKDTDIGVERGLILVRDTNGNIISISISI